MFLLDSSRFANDPTGMSEKVVALIEKMEGTVVAHRPWQDGRLAYEIEGRRKGVHYLSYFRMDPARMKEFDRACKLSEDVIRKLTIKQPEVLFQQMVAALTGETKEETPAEPKKSVKETENKTENEKETEKKSDSNVDVEEAPV